MQSRMPRPTDEPAMLVFATEARGLQYSKDNLSEARC